MIKHIFNDDYYERPLYDLFISKYESIKNTENTIIYYKFPRFRTYDNTTIYPDFLIIDPKRGIIVVNCIDEGNYKSREKISTLIDYSYQYVNLLKSALLKSKNREINHPRKGLVFDIAPYLFVAESLRNDLDDSMIEDIDIITEENINTIFNNNETIDIDQSTIDEIVAILEGSISLITKFERVAKERSPLSKSDVLKLLELEMALFDSKQKYGAHSILRGPQRIRGLAGSGKTIVLCMKAANILLQDENAVILYTFSTKSLYYFIEALITKFYKHFGNGESPDFENKIHIRHGWGGSTPGVYSDTCYNEGIIPLKYYELKDIKDPLNECCRRLLNRTNGVLNKRYDYVLIDEGQDFGSYFYQMCRYICKEDKLIWAYDSLQDIFSIKQQSIQDIFENQFGYESIDLGKTKAQFPEIENDIILYKCYRNPREILVVAHAIGFGIYNEVLIQNLENSEHWSDFGYNILQGNCVENDQMIIERPVEFSPNSISERYKFDEIIEVISSDNLRHECEVVSESISQLLKEEGLRAEDICIICMDERNLKLYSKVLNNELFNRGIILHDIATNAYSKGFQADSQVTFTTVNKAKGNETSVVYLLGCDSFENKKNDIRVRNKYFTAFTRAKAWLKVSGVDIMEESLVKEIIAVRNNNLEFRYKHVSSATIKRDLSAINAESQKLEKILDAIDKSNIDISDLLEFDKKRKSKVTK